MMSSAPDAVVLAGATFDASESICARLDIAVTMRTAQTIKMSFRILRIAARLIVATFEIVRDVWCPSCIGTASHDDWRWKSTVNH